MKLCHGGNFIAHVMLKLSVISLQFPFESRIPASLYTAESSSPVFYEVFRQDPFFEHLKHAPFLPDTFSLTEHVAFVNQGSAA